MKFNFKGKVFSSKSLVNRFLILSQGHSLSTSWESKAQDVLYLKEALHNYTNQKELFVGQGGTTLRFLAVYLSGLEGEWVLKGEESLFQRPQKELIDVLLSLGCEAVLKKDSLYLKTKGWQQNILTVSCAQTSQVATALLLAAVSLQKKITLHLEQLDQSSEYLNMTLNFLESLGVDVIKSSSTLVIDPPFQLQDSLEYLEGDWSSVAFLYCLGALFGSAEVINISLPSFQPDSVILELLKKMGAVVQNKKIMKSKELKPLTINLQKSPDLFPILASTLAFAEGQSLLHGAPQLRFKETDRIKKMTLLLKKCGYQLEEKEDGLLIHGKGSRIQEHTQFDFDCSEDHRLVMAAFILKQKGYDININGIHSVKKSFPEFFEIFAEHL